MKKRSLKEDVKVNKRNLPDDWEKQPEVYRYWADEWAFAVSDRDRAKEQKEMVYADLDSEVRLDPDAFELEKLTEPSIAATIKRQQEYIDACERVHDANLVVNRMVAARDAMEHKRDTLKNLTKLAIAGFYGHSMPSAEASVRKGQASRELFSQRLATKRSIVK